MKRVSTKKGFTLVELIITLSVLAILSAILIPLVSGYVEQSRAAVCLSNRRLLVSKYENLRAMYAYSGEGEITLQKVISGELDSLGGSVSALKCPSGGTYSVDEDGQLLCSIPSHDSVESTLPTQTHASATATPPTPTPTPSPTPSPTPTPTATPTLPPTTDPEIIGRLFTGSWEDAKTRAKSDGEITLLYAGSVYTDASGTYVIPYTWVITKDKAEADVTLLQYISQYGYTPIEITNTTPVLTSEDYGSGLFGRNWKDGRYPKYGSLYLYNGEYYVWRSNLGSMYTSTNPANELGFVKLTMGS